MSSKKEQTTPVPTYELACTDCTYETTVDGSVHEALDEAEAHQGQYGETATEHFVDVELSNRTA